MDYIFSAERKLVFTIRTGGRNLLVEFGDRNSGGMSSFATSDVKIAQAIRRTSLSRRGVIIESTPANQADTTPNPAPSSPSRPTLPNNPASPTIPDKPSASTGPSVRSYDNFTLAREAIVKEFGIRKSDVRNPTALARFAQEKGFTIKYNNAA